MTTPAAIKGTFADYKFIKTRKVLQIVIEVPLEQQSQVFDALGYPMPDAEHWVAVARLVGSPKPDQRPKENGDKPRTPFADLPLTQQAVLACKDEAFMTWLGAAGESAAAHWVRCHLGINSRSELNTDAIAAAAWKSLYSEYQQATGRTAEPR